jgi:PAT family beta-lactamase induction signal transducer AmpG
VKKKTKRNSGRLAASSMLWGGRFIAFFRAHGWLALVMLVAISLYRLPDFIMGPMANPYYHDIGLSKQTVGAVRGSIGLIATFAGIAAGGFCSLKLGYMRALIIGGILQAAATRRIATLAFAGLSIRLSRLVHGRRQLQPQLCRRCACSVHVEPHQSGIHRHAVCALEFNLCLLGKTLKGFPALGRKPERHARPIHAYGIFLIASGLRGVTCHPSFAALVTGQAEATAPAAPRKFFTGNPKATVGATPEAQVPGNPVSD